MTQKIVMWNAMHNFRDSVVLKFGVYLKKQVYDEDVKSYFTTLNIFGDGLKRFYAYEYVSDTDIGGWLSNFIGTDARMTPSKKSTTSINSTKY